MIDQPDTNLYAVLGVSSDASDTELDHAFRALARRLHPDMNPDDADATAFQRVLAAYAVLRDPVARNDYDRRQPPATEPARASTNTGHTVHTVRTGQPARKTAATGQPAGEWSRDALIEVVDPPGEPALRIGPVHEWPPDR